MKNVKLWTKGVEFEEAAKKQISNIASLPFVTHPVAVMPDVHAGCGATVGSVIPTKNVLIPAAVGVDIGCGMAALKTNIKARALPDNIKSIRFAIENVVPVGFCARPDISNLFKKVEPNQQIRGFFEKYNIDFTERQKKQLGTLGGGNHFIELCLDENEDVWIMLHSGSRGIGNRIGSQFIRVAKKEMEKWFISLPDSDLAYIPHHSEHFSAYIACVSWAQDFAKINRAVMLEEIIKVLTSYFPDFELLEEAVNCHHNYISIENHFNCNLYITRKGAVRAKKGELGIIPGSMGAKSYIVEGKGNKQSYCSCSHGAGRVMSRAQAKKQFTVEDQIKATEGVECKKDESVIDEIPMAYKDIDAVMEAQKDLVKIKHILKQVMCIKG